MTVSKDAINTLVKWLTGLPFLNVLILLGLVMFAGGGYYIVEHVIPGERVAIFEAVERQEQQHTKQIDRLTQSFDRTLDRIMLGNKAVSAVSTDEE